MARAKPRPDPRVLADFALGDRVELDLDGAWVPALVSFHGLVRREVGGRQGDLERLDPQTPAKRR